MEKIFAGKVTIVTGGASGIGQSTALVFARLGARVVVADWQDGSATVEQVKKAGSEGVFIKCDVSRDEDVKAMVDKAVQTYGRLDFGVNNAGIEGVQVPLQELTEKDWDKTINVNLKGIWLCMKYRYLIY